MNLANIEKRIESLQARLDKLRPREPAPPLVLQFNSEVNPNAPEGTRACDDDDGNEWSVFMMVPPGYRGALPEGVPTLEQWQWLRKENGKCPMKI